MNVGPAGGGAPVGPGGGGGGGGKKRPRDVAADLLEAKREKRMGDVASAVQAYNKLKEKGVADVNIIKILDFVFPDYVVEEALRQVGSRR